VRNPKALLLAVALQFLRRRGAGVACPTADDRTHPAKFAELIFRPSRSWRSAEMTITSAAPRIVRPISSNLTSRPLWERGGRKGK
jgi:hypothetical protein